MTEYMGEGLIKCHDCGAVVPSFESLIDLPGTPEHVMPCSVRSWMPPSTFNAQPTCARFHHARTVPATKAVTEIPAATQDETAPNQASVLSGCGPLWWFHIVGPPRWPNEAHFDLVVVVE